MPAFAPEGDTVTVFQGCSVNKHSGKDSLEQRVASAFLKKHVETRETCAELSPKTIKMEGQVSVYILKIKVICAH